MSCSLAARSVSAGRTPLIPTRPLMPSTKSSPTPCNLVICRPSATYPTTQSRATSSRAHRRQPTERSFSGGRGDESQRVRRRDDQPVERRRRRGPRRRHRRVARRLVLLAETCGKRTESPVFRLGASPGSGSIKGAEPLGVGGVGEGAVGSGGELRLQRPRCADLGSRGPHALGEPCEEARAE